MRSIRNLEMHVVHGCNFTCESCSHYSNQRHKGMLSLAEAAQWMGLWNRRINPKIVSLLGGEPTIHPDLADFLVLARKHWPEAHLQLVTNGSFLHRHPTLPVVLQKDPDASICLSVHHDAPEYLEKLQSAVTLLKKWIREYGIRAISRNSFKNWTRRYQGYGSAMEPYDDRQPRRSWEKCPAKYAAQLFVGKIWKCGPLAYLKMQDAKYQLSEKWKPYLQYRPLDPGCTDEELKEFFDREEESFCSMCPANPEKFTLPLPINSLSSPVPPLAAPTVGPMLRSRIRQLDLPLAEDQQSGWKPYPLFRGPTRHVRDLSCHVSVLSPGITPHRPHMHVEEEILIMLSGEADLVILNHESPRKATRHRLRPGSFVYYPAKQPHTIHNPGPQSATYLMFKWRAEHARTGSVMEKRIVRYFGEGLASGFGKGGFHALPVMEGATQHLGKLHCHLTTLQPGCGYRPHADPYDVAILVLQGTVKTLGRHVGQHGLAFCAAGEVHGMKNVGTVPAVYLVFEFHGYKEDSPLGEITPRAVPALAAGT